MRTIKELLKLVLEKSYKYKNFDGICSIIHINTPEVFDGEEFLLAKKYIREKRPKENDPKVHWFYGNFYDKSQKGSLYFFKPYKKNIRRAWLKHLIKTCTE